MRKWVGDFVEIITYPLIYKIKIMEKYNPKCYDVTILEKGMTVLYWGKVRCEVVEVGRSNGNTPLYTLESESGDQIDAAWDEEFTILN